MAWLLESSRPPVTTTLCFLSGPKHRAPREFPRCLIDLNSPLAAVSRAPPLQNPCACEQWSLLAQAFPGASQSIQRSSWHLSAGVSGASARTCVAANSAMQPYGSSRTEPEVFREDGGTVMQVPGGSSRTEPEVRYDWIPRASQIVPTVPSWGAELCHVLNSQ